MENISHILGKHYEKTFHAYGATPSGVDWRDQDTSDRRYHAMMNFGFHSNDPISLLDVGCGFGGLRGWIKDQGLDVRYTGIDVVEAMIKEGQSLYPDACFIHGDVLTTKFDRMFDYVVCNGILTQKLDIPLRDMDSFAKGLIRRMFDLTCVGVAFNVMSTYVNFFADNLFYKSPLEMMSFCMENITPHIKIDHSYKMYEYTVYLYK